MKNVLHMKNFNTVTIQVHVETSLILIIKGKNDDKLNYCFVKIKLSMNPTSEKSYLYELKIAFFDNVNLDQFLSFIRDFNMTFEASGIITSGTRIQYLHTMVRGEALRQFYMLSSEVVSATSENLASIILGLSTYFFPINDLSKKKRVVRCRMWMPHVLKVRSYDDFLIDLDKYLDVFPG